jgi:hypothetical protein
VGFTGIGSLGWLAAGSTSANDAVVDDRLVVYIHEASRWPWAFAFIGAALAVLFLVTGVRMMSDERSETTTDVPPPPPGYLPLKSGLLAPDPARPNKVREDERFTRSIK